MRKTKDRKDESNEGDQDGRNERKMQKGHPNREWYKAMEDERENQKATLGRRKKGNINKRKTPET